jgi:hypothetical protein
MRILREGHRVCKEENQLLDYHHKLAQLCQVADGQGKETLRKEMIRVREKHTFLESNKGN